jgi:hypothetical protein
VSFGGFYNVSRARVTDIDDRIVVVEKGARESAVARLREGGSFIHLSATAGGGNGQLAPNQLSIASHPGRRPRRRGRGPDAVARPQPDGLIARPPREAPERA